MVNDARNMVCLLGKQQAAGRASLRVTAWIATTAHRASAAQALGSTVLPQCVPNASYGADVQRYSAGFGVAAPSPSLLVCSALCLESLVHHCILEACDLCL